MGVFPEPAASASDIDLLFCLTHQPSPNTKMANFSGKWVFDRAENMEAVADALKVDKSKVPDDRSTTTEITQNGDTFQIKTITAVKTREVTFTVGTPFIDQDLKELRGIDVELTPSWEGSKLVMTGPKGNGASREIVNGQMVVTFTIDGVTGKRFFNKA